MVATKKTTARKPAAKKATAKKPAKKITPPVGKPMPRQINKPDAAKPAKYKKSDAAKHQRAQLAILQKRADSAGDAAQLVAAHFALAVDLVEAIDVMKMHIGVASAALYRELRTVLSDVVHIIESREEIATSDIGHDRLAVLLGAHDDDDA